MFDETVKRSNIGLFNMCDLVGLALFCHLYVYIYSLITSKFWFIRNLLMWLIICAANDRRVI